MAKPRDFAPQQARSRESLGRLLKAAVEVLGQRGVEGTTVPRIAAHAGLTPGSIYRRFRDKDDLLQTTLLKVYEDQDKSLRMQLTLQAAAALTLPALAEQVVSSLVLSYRVNAGLLRAMRQLLHASEGSPFWKKVGKLEKRTFEYLVSVLLSTRSQIKHPDPRAAVALALVMVIGTLWEIVVYSGDTKFWKSLMPVDDLSLKRELMRAFLRYLDADPGA